METKGKSTSPRRREDVPAAKYLESYAWSFVTEQATPDADVETEHFVAKFFEELTKRQSDNARVGKLIDGRFLIQAAELAKMSPLSEGSLRASNAENSVVLI